MTTTKIEREELADKLEKFGVAMKPPNEDLKRAAELLREDDEHYRAITRMIRKKLLINIIAGVDKPDELLALTQALRMCAEIDGRLGPGTPAGG